MANKITEHAMLVCDKGSTPSQLKVSSQDFCKAEDKLVATENDKEVEVNISSFGVCAITKSKCVPAVVKWTQTSEKDNINDLKILTEQSTCNCTVGGKISVKQKGHTEQHLID